MRYILACVFLLLSANSYALTTINNSTTFPYSATTNSETYRLSENITCPTTCIVASGDNMTIDLNGYTMTFGNSNDPSISDSDFENWSNSTTPTNWTVTSGTATRTTAVAWGSYDATLSATAVIKSGNVTLNANQTYIPYVVIKGDSADSVTIAIKKASDNSTLVSHTISGAELNRAFALSDGALATTEDEYKPSTNTSVYLEITCSGTSTKILHIADIAPARHYGVAGYSYQNTSYFPDLSSPTFGSAVNLTVTNGSIVQGAGHGVKSVGIMSDSSLTVTNVNGTMSGDNTAFINKTEGNLTVDNVDTDTTSRMMFNRMHPTACIDLGDVTAGNTVEISNCNFYNDPEMVIRSNGTLNTTETTSSIHIHDNNFFNKEQSTEGYGIAFTGVYGALIEDNVFEPVKGRGILLDSVSFGTLDGTSNITIKNNTFTIYEEPLAEYDAGSLEAVAIRVRNWGGASEQHSDILIQGNTITATTDADGVHGAYGVNLTVAATNDDIVVENNTVTVSQTGQDFASCFVHQNDGTTEPGNVEIRYNTCTTNDTAMKYGGNDGGNSNGIVFHHNKITSTGGNLFQFYSGGTQQNHDIYCNQILNSSTSDYPFYFDGTISDILIDYNQITNSNSGGYEAWADANESSDVLFYGSGTIDVTGGGSVGTAGSATNGSASCWTTAGAPESGGTSVSLGTVLLGQ